MSIQSEIARIISEVDTQEDLIAQAMAAVEGKAAGSGGGVEALTATGEFTLAEDLVSSGIDSFTYLDIDVGFVPDAFYVYQSDTFSGAYVLAESIGVRDISNVMRIVSHASKKIGGTTQGYLSGRASSYGEEIIGFAGAAYSGGYMYIPAGYKYKWKAIKYT